MNAQSNAAHNNLSQYNDLIAAYQEAFPDMSYFDAQSAARSVWNELKEKYGLGMSVSQTPHINFAT